MDELTYIFIEHVRNANYFPTFANPIIAEYIVARDFKLRLKRVIESKSMSHIDNLVFETNFDMFYTVPNYPDWILLRYMKLTSWQSYLFMWMQTGYSTVEISKIIHIPRETFSPEERHLWHLLKTNYFQQEV